MSQLRVNQITDVGGTGPAYAPGHVVQVVYGFQNTMVSTTSTTYQNTNLSANITPKFASSKILVIVTQPIYKGLQNTANGAILRILRNSTEVQYSGMMLYTGSAIDNTGVSAMQVLDSPNTTSQITYSTQFKNNAAATQIMVNYGNSSITLMEIAA